MKTHAVAVLLLSLVLAGCANRLGQDSVTPPSDGTTDPGGIGISNPGDPGNLQTLMVPSPGHDPQLFTMVLLFAYDSDDIRPEYLPILNAHAQFLLGNPLRRVRLEGHTDERGTREYNVALGERRALKVRDVLLLAGVPASQITIVSYGEELPVVRTSSEESWEQNRRVELVYRP